MSIHLSSSSLFEEGSEAFGKLRLVGAITGDDGMLDIPCPSADDTDAGQGPLSPVAEDGDFQSSWKMNPHDEVAAVKMTVGSEAYVAPRKSPCKMGKCDDGNKLPPIGGPGEKAWRVSGDGEIRGVGAKRSYPPRRPSVGKHTIGGSPLCGPGQKKPLGCQPGCLQAPEVLARMRNRVHQSFMNCLCYECHVLRGCVTRNSSYEDKMSMLRDARDIRRGYYGPVPWSGQETCMCGREYLRMGLYFVTPNEIMKRVLCGETIRFDCECGHWRVAVTPNEGRMMSVTVKRPCGSVTRVCDNPFDLIDEVGMGM